MRKVFLLSALSAVAAMSLGCALTDYPALEPVNKSHGVIDCSLSQDRIANTQQTTEPSYREMFFRDPDVGGDFGPFLLTERVDHSTAREWGRFIGPFAALQGIGVSPGGQWEMGGVKDLADGSVRITTYFQELPASGFPPFSCGFGGAVAVSASEGGVQSQSLPGLEPAGAVPGAYMIPETVAIDADSGTLNWGSNMVAMKPQIAADGYSGLVGANARIEYHVSATPVTRRAGSIGNLISGNVETFTFPEDSDLAGLSLTAWGEMNEKGIVMNVTSLETADGALYQAGEDPIRLQLGQLGERKLQIEATPSERLKVLTFAREAGLLDRRIDLPAHVEGIPMPPLSVRFSGDFVDARIEELTEELSGEGDGGGFGG